MLNTHDAFHRRLRGRDVFIALGGLALWVVVAPLVAGVAASWLPGRPAEVAGHVAGSLVFGIVMQRFVYRRRPAPGPARSNEARKQTRE